MVEKILTVSLCVIGLWACCWEGMIFGMVRNVLPEDSYLAKPFFSCPICMCPWWGTPIYLYIYREEWRDWWWVVLAAMGLNTILIKFFPPDE